MAERCVGERRGVNERARERAIHCGLRASKILQLNDNKERLPNTEFQYLFLSVFHRENFVNSN